MKLFIAVLGCALLVTMGCSHVSVKSAPYVSGVWVDESYLRALRHSLSPKAALVATGIPAFALDKNSTMLVTYVFHEGGEYSIKRIDPFSGRIVLSADSAFKSLVYVGDRIHAVYVYHDREISTEFSRIASFQEDLQGTVGSYVSSLVLNGRYENTDGRTYSFESPSTNWDGQDYVYRVWLDYVEFTPVDVICVKTKEVDRPCKTYGFATNGAMLQIYEYNEDAKAIGRLITELYKK